MAASLATLLHRWMHVDPPLTGANGVQWPCENARPLHGEQLPLPMPTRGIIQLDRNWDQAVSRRAYLYCLRETAGRAKKERAAYR